MHACVTIKQDFHIFFYNSFCFSPLQCFILFSTVFLSYSSKALPSALHVKQAVKRRREGSRELGKREKSPEVSDECKERKEGERDGEQEREGRNERPCNLWLSLSQWFYTGSSIWWGAKEGEHGGLGGKQHLAVKVRRWGAKLVYFGAKVFFKKGGKPGTTDVGCQKRTKARTWRWI